MSDTLIRRFLEDANITLEKKELVNYTEFVQEYFKGLVKFGVFLSDVPFRHIAPRGRNMVLRQAYNLWKKAQYERELV